jgi:hypothetical protein
LKKLDEVAGLISSNNNKTRISPKMLEDYTTGWNILNKSHLNFFFLRMYLQVLVGILFILLLIWFFLWYRFSGRVEIIAGEQTVALVCMCSFFLYFHNK